MIARCIALGLPMAEVPIRTIYAGEPSHIRPWAHFTSFLRVSRDARRIVRGGPMSAPLTAGDARSTSPRLARPAAAPPRRAGPDVLVVVVALALGSATVAVLERVGGFDNGSPAFLLAVVAVAVLRGTGPAIATAIGSFLVYDFLFIEPLYTLTVRDPGEWLNLLLLLVVGIVVGRLAGRERDRADRGDRRRARGAARCSTSASPSRPNGIRRRPWPTIARMVVRRDRAPAASGSWSARRSWPTPHRPAAPAPRQPGGPRHAPSTPRRRAGRMGPRPRPGRDAEGRASPATRRLPRRDRRGRSDARGHLGRSGREGWAIPTTARRASSPPPPTRSAARSSATGSGARRPRPRSRGGARPSSRRCSTRSRTTCERRSRPSGPPPACSWIPMSSGRPTSAARSPAPSTARPSG